MIIKNLSVYAIIILLALTFFIDLVPDRITNLASCEGELNVNKRETTTVTYRDGTTESYIDYCVRENILHESYCHSQSEMRTKKLFCPGGCVDNICFSSESERLGILGLQGFESGETESIPPGGASRNGDRKSTFTRGGTGGKQIDTKEIINARRRQQQGAQVDGIVSIGESGLFIPERILHKLREDPSQLTYEELDEIRFSLAESIIPETNDKVLEVTMGNYILSLIKTTTVHGITQKATATSDGIVINFDDGLILFVPKTEKTAKNYNLIIN